MKNLESELVREVNDREENDNKIGNYLTSELRNIDEELLELSKKSQAMEKSHYETIKSTIADIRKDLDNEIVAR